MVDFSLMKTLEIPREFLNVSTQTRQKSSILSRCGDLLGTLLN